MAKAINKKNTKSKKQVSESSSKQEEENDNVQNKLSEDENFSESSSHESKTEYSQEQLEDAIQELEEVEVSESISEEASEDETVSGSNEEEGEDDETLRTIFIKDIDYDLKEEELAEQLKRLGEIVRVTIPLTHDQRRNKGFAYVEFKKVSDAKKGLKLDGTELLGRKITVSQARPKSNMKIFTVFVKNLSYNTTKEELEEHFGKYGKLYNVSLPNDPENPERNRGFCFVEFNDEECIQSILKAKHNLDGRTLYISEGNKNQQRNNDRSSDRLYGRRDDQRSGNDRFDRKDRSNDRFERKDRNNDRFERKDRSNDRFERRDRSSDRFERKDNQYQKFERRGRDGDKSNRDGGKFRKDDKFDRNNKRSQEKFDKNKKGNKVVFDDNSD